MFKYKYFFSGLFLLFCLSGTTLAQGLNFSFQSARLVGTGPYFYEVNIMLDADVAGTRVGDTQVYIDYNPLAFGDSVATRGRAAAFKSFLTAGDENGVQLYTVRNVADHGTNQIAVTITYDFDSNTSLANEVEVGVKRGLFRLQIEVENRAWLSGVSIDDTYMQGQQFLADNQTQYNILDVGGISDIVLGVENVDNTTIPTEFKMHQNYPNPFNPETTVRFELPANLGGENVSLVVYDMLGRKVRTLQDGPLSAGTYELKWDAKTDNGADLASGTYLLRLQAKRQQQIIKMLLMK